MDAKAIRQLTDQEISAQIIEQREALYNLRFRQAAGQLEDTTMLRKTKRIIARLKTIQHERVLAAQQAESEGK
jgi:large subunit ribosomal protein L29